MSFISVMIPAQTALPVVPAVTGQLSMVIQASLALGLLGIALTLCMVLKPRILASVAWLSLSAPRLRGVLQRPQQCQSQRDRGQDARLLQRLARRFDQSEPGLAAELRYLGRS